jgi:hypothetical protein
MRPRMCVIKTREYRRVVDRQKMHARNDRVTAFGTVTPRYVLACLKVRQVVVRPVSGLVSSDSAPSQVLHSVADSSIMNNAHLPLRGQHRTY